MATTPESADIDLSGRDIGGYRVLRRLGRGAMAEVYLAEQTSLRRQVALKVLRRDLAQDEMYVKRFHLEAQAAAALVHANIVQIHEVGCAEGVHFIAQEYVQGMNLQELLTRRGPPDLRQAVGIMRQTTAALRKAAEQGIVHRDIKPENIMLASSGEVKVADFGLARVLGADQGVNLTRIGFTMGTPLYMSPEQVEGKPLDSRSDIYSLGVTCYQMLAGEAPFRGETALSVAVQHLKQQPDRLDNVRPDLPAPLCRVIHKMLAKNPDDRYATPADLARDLRALALGGDEADTEEDLKGLASEAGAATESRLAATQRLGVIMRTSAMPIHTGRRKLLVALCVLAALLLGGAAAWATRTPSLLAAPEDDGSNVDRRESAQAQFIYALMVDTEDGWKSVERYFPSDKEKVNLARQQLALLYLQEDDNKRALALFTEFANEPDEEAQLRAFGLAGQAIALANQGKLKEASDKLAQIDDSLRDKLDPQMAEQVRALLRRKGKSLSGFGGQGRGRPQGFGGQNPGGRRERDPARGAEPAKGDAPSGAPAAAAEAAGGPEKTGAATAKESPPSKEVSPAKENPPTTQSPPIKEK